MTTPRTRRSKPQQAAGILTKLRQEQQAEVAKRKAALQEAEAELAKTEKVLEALGQAVLPGMEIPSQPIGYGGTGDDLGAPVNTATVREREKLTDASEPVPSPYSTNAVVVDLRPHRQKIDKQAKGLDDVWKEGADIVTVHTALMYERQERCELCRAGNPFATEERLLHHIPATNAPNGIPLSGALPLSMRFDVKPCTGAA